MQWWVKDFKYLILSPKKVFFIIVSEKKSLAFHGKCYLGIVGNSLYKMYPTLSVFYVDGKKNTKQKKKQKKEKQKRQMPP